jgi:hypothetical protein
MLRWLAHRQLATFERAYDYDASYIHEMMDISWPAGRRFIPLMKMSSFREDIPAAAWFAAKIIGTMAEDCGPCAQLSVSMAEREGVSAEVLRGIINGDETAMGEDVALVARFTRAVLAHDLAADGLRQKIAARWGKRAVVTLAMAITSARLYPTMKYALGHGQACARLRVGGVETHLRGHLEPTTALSATPT